MSGHAWGCGRTGRARHGPAAGSARGHAVMAFAGATAMAPRAGGSFGLLTAKRVPRLVAKRVPPRWAACPPFTSAVACRADRGRGAGLEMGKIVPNQHLSGAVVSSVSRPGERWQEAAGSAELFLAAAGALGSGREERPPHHHF